MDKRLFDKRVRKNIVIDTETAPYYEKVDKPIRKTGISERKDLPRDATNVEEYTYNGKQYLKCTTYTKQVQLVFDIGYTICNNKGDILIKRNMLVSEVVYNFDLISNAFYFKKFPRYLKLLNDGEIKILTWIEILQQIERDIIDYGIKNMYAYNMNFDKRAIYETSRVVNKRKPYFFEYEHVNFNCLWSMSCQSIFKRKAFFDLAKQEKWFTECGNIITNAESCYRFISNNVTFEESHTALDDAIIETAILAKCLRTHQKMKLGIIAMPYKMVQEYGKERGYIK